VESQGGAARTDVLDRAVESVREQFESEIDAQLVETDPVSALLATICDGDLLVLGSRGRGAVRAGLFGSTVNGVLDRSAVPVVVVKGIDDGE
jgi:nucleotide-binding universal stress UspA family protein